MEGVSGPEVGCSSGGDKAEEIGFESLQLGEDIERLMTAPARETASSFTALLELPANQAVELLHSPDKDQAPAPLPAGVWSNRMHSIICTPTFPSNAALLERASKFSFFAAGSNSGEVSSIPGNSSVNQQKVKQEPADSDSNPKYSDPIAPNSNPKSTKRKEREKKEKGSSKKSKNASNDASDDGEKLPYVHVRARRGQATDNHSLAERARREKINARMKLLQELVPGCNKISGTALVLDEIINHVQALQRQVEFLSMRLAAVNPRIDFNLDSLLAAENGSPADSNSLSMVMPLMWPEGPVNRNREHSQQLCHFDGFHQPIWGREDIANFITPENSLMSFNSSTNSVCLHSNQLRMEL